MAAHFPLYTVIDYRQMKCFPLDIWARPIVFPSRSRPFFSVFLFCLSRAGEWIKQYELSVSEPSTGFRSTAAEKEKKRTIRMPIGCGS